MVIHAPGLSGMPVARPSIERDREGFLDRVFREVEAPDRADQGRDRPPRLTPEQTIDDLVGGRGHACGSSGSPMTGRSSIVPYGAPGHSAAASIASSRLSTSSR